MDPAALIVALLGGGGLLGGIVALLRIRPESGKMIVEAAEGAVVVQSGVITELRTELSDLRVELDETRDALERRDAEFRAVLEHKDHCERELAAHATELRTCRAELEELRRRLARAGINGGDR